MNNTTPTTTSTIPETKVSTPVTPETKVSTPVEGFFYIIKTADTDDNVYKIGKTVQSNPNKRLCAYPKYSSVIYTIAVSDADTFEDYTMRKFRIFFKRRMEYGLEYYETNDVKQMINVVHWIWMRHGDKRILIDTRLDGIKPAGLQHFVNEWYSKQFSINSNINLDTAYEAYKRIIETDFCTTDYASRNIFIVYMSHIINS